MKYDSMMLCFTMCCRSFILYAMHTLFRYHIFHSHFSGTDRVCVVFNVFTVDHLVNTRFENQILGEPYIITTKCILGRKLWILPAIGITKSSVIDFVC